MNERTACVTRLAAPPSRGSDGTSVASIATCSSITVRTTVRLKVTPCGTLLSRARIAAGRRPSGASPSASSRNTRSLGSTSKVRSASRASTSGSGRTDRSMRPTSAKIDSTRSAVITSLFVWSDDRSPTLRTMVASAGRASNCTTRLAVRQRQVDLAQPYPVAGDDLGFRRDAPAADKRPAAAAQVRDETPVPVDAELRMPSGHAARREHDLRRRRPAGYRVAGAQIEFERFAENRSLKAEH